ncbi:MAG: ribosome-associated translation inhibitor RaiA [Prevotella sp.]|nr:ribosome-associated translation inhibitor RaiA [Candidatus Equicola faecalis]MDO4818933.1 ribosome-associated translation inhibitor RaiA [Prevotella sp.]
MELQIKAINFEATEKLQAFVEKKAAKLEKQCDEVQKVEVQLKVVKPQTAVNKTVTLEVKVPGKSFFTEKTTDTFEQGVDDCIDAMKIQLVKYKEKLREH